jgi:acetyl-CoA carboxylase carboxyltransferase component
MGPEPAVSAVYYNRIHAIEDPEERAEFVAAKRAEYEAGIDLIRLASDNVVDAVVQPDELRAEISRRLGSLAQKPHRFRGLRGVPPV